jgi:hypothetical protein
MKLIKTLCDWLGRFAVHTANLAQRDGFKVSLFAWSSGEPEPEGWEDARHVGHTCDSVQSVPIKRLWRCMNTAMSETISRMAFHSKSAVLSSCSMCVIITLIARPTVHITEWGWTLGYTVPSSEHAIKDIDEIMKLYGRYP